MPKSTHIVPVFFVFISILFVGCHNEENRAFLLEENVNKQVPGDWFFKQRAFPQGKINHTSYYQAIQAQKSVIQTRNNDPWIPVGPTNIGGRITDIEVHPSQPATVYFGAAAGGIFKSEDDGLSWTPIFDDAENLAIGDFAIAPNDPKTLYVGTGEANGGGNSLSYDGNGVYRTSNGGNSWTNIGLTNVGSIGKIEIDPKRPERIFVAAMGRLFESTPNRGIYRSLDSGQNWEKVLFESDSTGAIDVVINPLHPDTIYAVLWERVRSLKRRSYGGETSGIYRSTDGGNSWTPLTNGLPNVGPRKGRIGLSISASDPNILYAVYATQTGNLEGIYKTENHGESWTRINTNGVTSVSFMWWFGKIQIDPIDPDIVYMPGLDIVKTLNGGENWYEVFIGTHVDQHAIWIHPDDPDLVWLGNDGGLFKSEDGGNNYDKITPLPITQFYSASSDPNFPERLYGGTQDNGVMRTLTGAQDDWNILIYADGFSTLLSPDDPDFILTEFQFGSLRRSLDDGLSFTIASPALETGERTNWHAPLAMNPKNSSTIYFGRNRLYRSSDKARRWELISPDLTNGPHEGNLVFGTLSTISVSPVDTNLIYTGSDDGKVYVTKNGGSEWQDISAGLPERWVTKIQASPFDLSTVYVTLSGYKSNHSDAHVYVSTDAGQNWTPIDANLPDVPVNDLDINLQTQQLYVATDIGVYSSDNQGGSWELMGTDLPNVVVTDLIYDDQRSVLYAATYGRSIFKYELSSPTPVTTLPAMDFKAKVFPNPSSGQFQFEFELEQKAFINIAVHNAQGQLLSMLTSRSFQADKHLLSFDLSKFTAGLYFLSISNKRGRQQYELILQ